MITVISRRALIAGIAASTLATPLVAKAQQAGKMFRLGILGNVPLSDAQGARLWGALTQGLRDLGYVEGQNLIVDLLWSPATRSSLLLLDEAKRAARTLGLLLQNVQARRPEEIDSAFASMIRQRAGALIVLGDAMFILQRRRIADLATRSRLPAMYVLREHMEAASDLPVEQPTKFDLVINLTTAKTLGLTIPPALLLRAHEVLE